MTESWTARWAAVAVMAALVGAAPASARVTTSFSARLTLSGAMLITWHGDPARGCASDNVCGISGALRLTGETGSQGQSSSGGPLELNVQVSGTARVRNGAESPAGECVDGISTAPFGTSLDVIKRTRWSASLQPPPSSGRCAGPLGADLARLPVPLMVSGRRYPTFDLKGTRSFTSGPFSGAMTSTMVLRTSPGGGSGGFAGGSSGSFTGSFFPTATRKSLFEGVILRYRASIIASSIDASFNGSSDPSCQNLDSCGAAGSVGFSAAPRSSAVSVTASRAVRTSVGRRRVLSDLRAGRLSLDFPAVMPSPGLVTETFSWGDGSTCGASIPTSNVGLVLGPTNGPPSGHALPVSLVNLDPTPFGVDLLRTYCPGPSDIDVIGQNGVLASASLKPAQLLEKQLTVTLRKAGGFSGPGYIGQRSGDVVLELTLLHVSAGTTTGQR